MDGEHCMLDCAVEPRRGKWLGKHRDAIWRVAKTQWREAGVWDGIGKEHVIGGNDVVGRFFNSWSLEFEGSSRDSWSIQNWIRFRGYRKVSYGLQFAGRG